MGTHTLDVEITGQGRNLVLLHSLLSDRSSFGLVVSRLADQRRLIAVSLPGFGLSPAAAKLRALRLAKEAADKKKEDDG